jgi:NADH:ubiquinone oxidoreductase subunit 5 (subunit L)/multisubunit Na+/H+ antiporter MnhA subunit
MLNGSMSENTNTATVNDRGRLFLALPFVILAFVALTVGFVASKTLRQPYQTAFLRLLFSDPLHMKVWLVTAALLLALGQLLTASRIYEVLNWNKSARILVSHSPNSRRPGKRTPGTQFHIG